MTGRAFTAADFAKAAGLREERALAILEGFQAAGVVERPAQSPVGRDRARPPPQQRARLRRTGRVAPMSDPVAITLPADAVEAIAARAAEIVLERLAERDNGGSPWLAGAQAAADYLGWPRERVYKRLHELPHCRDEGRLMFLRAELDAHLEQHRER
jgi:hypothetical protein